MLHESLLDLAEQAPRCQQVATARGVLAESHDLLRNALAHNTPGAELTHWYSTLVSDILHSPAISGLLGENQLVLTGAIGRGDGFPTSRVEWLLVTADPAETGEAANAGVAALLRSVGVTAAPLGAEFSPTTKAGWLQRIEQATASGDPTAIGVFADAGTWFREHLLTHLGSVLPLLHEAIEHRPPALRSEHGLPDRESPVDLRRELLAPVTDLARWAGLSTHTHRLTTRDHIQAGQAAGILDEDEAELLSQGWTTGADLQLRRWADHVVDRAITAADLPALQRSAFGAASRGVALVIRSLAARHDIDIPGDGS